MPSCGQLVLDTADIVRDRDVALMPNEHVLLAADAGPNPITESGDAAAGSAIISNIHSTAGLQVTWSVSQADGTFERDTTRNCHHQH
jgi:hypothetical protein